MKCVYQVKRISKCFNLSLKVTSQIKVMYSSTSGSLSLGQECIQWRAIDARRLPSPGHEEIPALLKGNLQSSSHSRTHCGRPRWKKKTQEGIFLSINKAMWLLWVAKYKLLRIAFLTHGSASLLSSCNSSNEKVIGQQCPTLIFFLGPFLISQVLT